MPTTYTPSGQDWAPTNVGRSTINAKPTASSLNAMKRAGLVTSEKKFGAGGNTSAHGATVMSARKLEETDELKHQRVDKSLSKAIQQARMAKNMTQKELATAINEKPQIIAEYESGKAIPNGQIIVKIEQKLGCKLPRPGKKPSSGTSSSTSGAQGSGLKSTNGVTRGGPPKRK